MSQRTNKQLPPPPHFRRIHMLDHRLTREQAVHLLVALELDDGQERFSQIDWEEFKVGHAGFWFTDTSGHRVEVRWEDLTAAELERLVNHAPECLRVSAFASAALNRYCPT